jgi:hypothetical protein
VNLGKLCADNGRWGSAIAGECALRTLFVAALAVAISTVSVVSTTGVASAQTPVPATAAGSEQAPGQEVPAEKPGAAASTALDAAPAAAPDTSTEKAAAEAPSKSIMRPAKQGGSAQTMPPGDKVTVKFTYNTKILVPKGSDLKVSVQGPAGANTQSFKTKNDAPPYTAVLKLPPDAKFPLKASAVLASTIGHQFTADFEIKQENAKGSQLAVTMNAK